MKICIYKFVTGYGSKVILWSDQYLQKYKLRTNENILNIEVLFVFLGNASDKFYGRNATNQSINAYTNIEKYIQKRKLNC